jgi:hypothetical protein
VTDVVGLDAAGSKFPNLVFFVSLLSQILDLTKGLKDVVVSGKR